MLKSIKKSGKKPVRKAVKKSAPKKAVKRAATKVKAKPKSKAKPNKPTASLLKPPAKIGEVTHYYNEIKVAIVKFSKPPKIGAEIRFKGATTDFKQPIASAQYDHKPLKIIPKGKQIGIKVRSRVRQGDAVSLVK